MTILFWIGTAAISVGLELLGFHLAGDIVFVMWACVSVLLRDDL